MHRRVVVQQQDVWSGVQQMQTADWQTGRLYILLPLPSLIADCKQANRSAI